ncbi:23S rRNA (pseudouridine(1915)-N(3))-methyltransferase RlmH [Acidiferrobacter sp.]|uniref:23S rRNA (pseudouridine(1915)-N(3))-methyltransferase RlmH n=1 Tax=Acidiferrobacter sp. TaxID=1872107 RepID=UPI002616E1AC|nr:23S rRNA (pseudouridine(1915)-N(3))-methyltransferase RlmH [Acidiferrobacter sp.]
MRLLAIGTRVPGWVQAGFADYARRLPGPYRLELSEIAPARWTRGGDRDKGRREEGERLLGAAPRHALIVALDVAGRMRTSEALACDLEAWLATGRPLVFLIGGAEGLADACLNAASDRWSLSPLVFPHALVRVMLAEQIYRAYSALSGQPYHRGSS